MLSFFLTLSHLLMHPLQKAMSVVEVTKSGTFNGGVPIRGGLNDPALGTCDLRATCSTCKNTYSGSGKENDCPGHFGHIEVSVTACS